MLEQDRITRSTITTSHVEMTTSKLDVAEFEQDRIEPNITQVESDIRPTPTEIAHEIKVKATALFGEHIADLLLHSGGSAETTFETLALNLASHPYSLSYNAEGDLERKQFTLDGASINIDYSYDSEGSLIKKAITGGVPEEILLTKNYSYVNDNLDNVTYTA